MSTNISVSSHGNGNNNVTDTFPPSHKELIKWAKAYPRSSQAQQQMKKSRRIVSMDDTNYLTRKDSGYSTSEEKDSIKNRSLSEFTPPSLAATLLMHPLNFEVIDVGNTPLSSLRSCSEFNKPGSYHGTNRNNHSENIPTESIFSQIYQWTFTSKKKRVNTSTLKKEEQMYLVEHLRFRPSTDDETILSSFFPNHHLNSNHFHSNHPSDLNTTSRSGSKYPFITSAYYGSSNSGASGGGGDDDCYNYDYEDYKRHNKANKRSFLSESSFPLDIVFGFGNSSYKGPKEIELREFSRSTGVSGITTRTSIRDLPSLIDSDDDVVGGGGGLSSSPSSLLLLDRRSAFLNRSSESNDTSSNTHATTISSLQNNHQINGIMGWNIFYGSYRSIIPILIEYLRKFAKFCSSTIIGEEDDFYYDSIRLQPFASGAYLRGMLLAGFTNFFFTAYGLALWPIHNSTTVLLPYHIAFENILYSLLFLQFIANICQLPLRLRIHYCCWESSRAVDVEAAIELLRELVHSEYWMANRGIGRCIDALSIICLILGELYLWLTPSKDPLRPLSVSMCATIILSLFVRTTVAILFTVSMHDPQILSDARRRGLSRWDLDSLPTFVFTNNDEVNNCDCPICLCSFDMGEMLISLPCNHKHSFHAGCIRQWLQRQNSCPLCQRLV